MTSQGGTASKLHGLQVPLRRFGGAAAARVIDGGTCTVEEHAHDWPVLSIFVAGEYRNRSELGERTVCSPAAILYRGGDAHWNKIGDLGHDQVEIEFDPSWAGGTLRLDRPQVWIGGPVAAAARRLFRLWSVSELSELVLASATRNFLRFAFSSKAQVRPPWLDGAFAAVRSQEAPSTASLAERLGLSPAWFAHAYRNAVGEGLGETVRRLRVERASALLRHTEMSAAEIAAVAGFCDQSHMIRSFNAVLLHTPNNVRHAWLCRPR